MEQGSSRCKICGNRAHNTTHIVREMMFKTGEEFAYLLCGECGTLQLQNPPHDMGKYYPPDYYSFGEQRLTEDNPLKSFLRRRLYAIFAYRKERYRKTGRAEIREPHYFQWLAKLYRRYSIALPSRILDVGCGSGDLLLCMQKDGYSNLVGVDPFTTREFRFGSLEILKREVFDVKGIFDCIMMHHALEHVPDPFKTIATSIIFCSRPDLHLSGFRFFLHPYGKNMIRIGLALRHRVTFIFSR